MQADRPCRQTDVIALFLGYNPRSVEYFPNMMISGLITRLFHHRMRLMVYGQSFYNTPEQLYQSLTCGDAAGVIILPPTGNPVLNMLAQSRFPTITIADRASGLPSVLVDNEMGTFMLAEHLSIRGHRKVIYRRDPYEHESANRRHEAFEKAATYLGMEVVTTLPADSFGGLSPEEAALLRGPLGRRPTAVVCWVDSYAYPVLKFCKQYGLNVPNDVAIAGFDGIALPIDPARKLTTVHAPWQQVAEQAADLLVELLRGGTIPEETILPVDLLIGDTT